MLNDLFRIEYSFSFDMNYSSSFFQFLKWFNFDYDRSIAFEYPNYLYSTKPDIYNNI